ncbi:MAG: hypothetical protein EOM54_11085 [Clostridia bacterium]|nr:hypothetical protein [Clostridia bacterium]
MKKTITYLLCAVFLLVLMSACSMTNGKVSPSPSPTSTTIVTNTPRPTVTVSPTNTPMTTQTPATPTIQAP